ncbi:MAG: GDSL-type esterase/lipase family protein [Vicinamibacterales bacterium]|jgi:lysophospholipase L1-like esterase|nr:GDSL-type esterase/lipase family protein [Vicinamibacterales bacterium]
MVTKPRLRSFALVLLLLSSAGLVAQQDTSTGNRDRSIAFFGSSVPNGTGDETGQGGYTGRMRTLLEPRRWEVLNRSRGGDNTVTIRPRFEPDGVADPNTRYLTPGNPGYAVLALSLGNEGIMECAPGQTRRCTSTRDEADRIYDQFATGLWDLVERTRAAGIVPIVTLCYTRGDFNAREYAYTRRMNLLINSWDVPSVNLLGAIDDGAGRWAPGFVADPSHPNSAGHTEMAHAFVPSLFDALAAGKPLPVKSTASGFVRVRDGSAAPLTFSPDTTMRSFAVSFLVRASGDGAVAAVAGQTLDHAAQQREYGRRRQSIEVYTLTPSGRTRTRLAVVDGRLTYTASTGQVLAATVDAADGGWHHVVLSHYAARGETLLFVDGDLAGSVNERLQPDRFVLGGAGGTGTSAPEQADYKDWMIHRAGLNADEAAELHAGTLLQASLEVYAPLTGLDDVAADNLAQSLSVIEVQSAGVIHSQD